MIFANHHNLTASGTHALHSGKAHLCRIAFNNPVTGVATIYDSEEASGTKIGAVTTVANQTPFLLEYSCLCNNGLTVSLSVDMDVTVVCMDAL